MAAAVTCRVLQWRLQKYRLNCHDVARGTFYYQCVYLTVEPDAEVMQAAALAR
jgi:hypothetical protein